jgi:hypothetical protein
MPMETINIEWLHKIQKVHDKFERSIPISSPNKECTQSIFINRCFKFLYNKAYKLKIKDDVYYALFIKLNGKISGTDYYFNNYGVRKVLGYNNSEVIISFLNEKFTYQEIKLHWNDIIKIEFEEIPLQKYYEIVNLFT